MAPWLGRWTSADPSGIADGVNEYAYVGGNPVLFLDPTGRDGVSARLMPRPIDLRTVQLPPPPLDIAKHLFNAAIGKVPEPIPDVEPGPDHQKPWIKPILYDFRTSVPVQTVGGAISGGIRAFCPPLMLFRPAPSSSEFAASETAAELTVGFGAMLLGGKGPTTGGTSGVDGSMAMVSIGVGTEVRVLVAAVTMMTRGAGTPPKAAAPGDSKESATEDSQSKKAEERAPAQEAQPKTSVEKAREAGQGLPADSKKWGNCDQFAGDLKAKLQTEAVSGIQIKVEPPSKYYALRSKMFGALGAAGGDHFAVQVGDQIFDNFRPGGVPAKDFWNDLVESEFLNQQGYVKRASF